MKKILISGGKFPDGKVADVLISGGKILRVGKNLKAAADEKIDARGKIVSAGLIDIHVHLRDPGFTKKETIATGTRAAAAGGVTTVVAMPNSQPRLDTPARVKNFLVRAKKEAAVRVLTTANLTKNGEGKILADFAGLKKVGAKFLTDDGCGDSHPQNLATEREVLVAAKKAGIRVLMHAEDSSLKKINSAACETTAVARTLELVRETGGAVHFTHLSAAGSVRLIRAAKADGLPITADTTPHHLTLTNSAIKKFGANAKMNPPLRSSRDCEALAAGVADGTIDAIATDHAPHLLSEKNCAFEKAAPGIVGLETLFPICWTELVEKKKLSAARFFEATTAAPARLLNLKIGELKVGMPADVVIWDVKNSYKIDAKKFESKGRNTPWHGKKVCGRAEAVFFGGKKIK